MNMQLYGGLFVFIGFIMYDTQVIIEKATRGSLNVVQHALELFLGTTPSLLPAPATNLLFFADFVNVFVRLLVILAKNNQKSEKRKRSD